MGISSTRPAKWIITLPDKASAELVDCQIELSGENPYGEVHSRTLFLRAWITTCPTYALNKIGRLELDEHSSNPTHYFSKSEIVSFIGSEDCAVSFSASSRRKLTIGPTVCTAMRCGKVVLEPLPEPRRGSYERLGMILRPSETHEDFDLTG